MSEREKQNLHMIFKRPINDKGKEKIATFLHIGIFGIKILKIRDYEYKKVDI